VECYCGALRESTVSTSIVLEKSYTELQDMIQAFNEEEGDGNRFFLDPPLLLKEDALVVDLNEEQKVMAGKFEVLLKQSEQLKQSKLQKQESLEVPIYLILRMKNNLWMRNLHLLAKR
jgi:hypothetical protein